MEQLISITSSEFHEGRRYDRLRRPYNRRFSPINTQAVTVADRTAIKRIYHLPWRHYIGTSDRNRCAVQFLLANCRENLFDSRARRKYIRTQPDRHTDAHCRLQRHLKIRPAILLMSENNRCRTRPCVRLCVCKRHSDVRRYVFDHIFLDNT